MQKSATDTIFSTLKGISLSQPEKSAILGVDRPGLTYEGLIKQIELTMAWLNWHGLGRNDRIAIVLPNGPEMASCFVCAVCAATAAPLNPAYRAEEFAFYLKDLGAKALIVMQGSSSVAVEEARKLNLAILQLVKGERTGQFTLEGEVEAKPAENPGSAQPEDIALVLHTSGTTARPKLVPLTQANLTVSAHNSRVALELTEKDRCLNVMPLFHVHGLMAAVVGSLFAGGSVVCTPGFASGEFFGWMAEFSPSWTTAVPTIHQAVLEQARKLPEVRHTMRMIRSCSAPLPPPVMAELEEVFAVPVIEAYGMTESSHQVASNPLPPGKRKPGSVGLPAGPEVCILDEKGSRLPVGQIGEICLRGGNVTAGYESNPEANRKTFTDGWFRTGDQGWIDEDGYIFIQGRVKEIINRGGEKISPREVDEILLEHPAVAQAVTFAAPHTQLGESVAAAVVLKANSTVMANELRAFVAKRAAYIKVPEVIVFMEQLPKGPTGKLQRVGLAEKLGIGPVDKMERVRAEEYVAPGNPLEEALAEAWMEILQLPKVGIHDHFLDLGGDSLKAALLVSRLNAALEIEISLAEFFAAPTVANLAKLIEELTATEEN